RREGGNGSSGSGRLRCRGRATSSPRSPRKPGRSGPPPASPWRPRPPAPWAGTRVGRGLAWCSPARRRRRAPRPAPCWGAGAPAAPLLAVAPLISLFLGSGLAFRTAVIALVCFPSMVIYSYKGLISVDERSLNLLASYDASHLQVFRHLRFPTSLPFVFTSM